MTTSKAERFLGSAFQAWAMVTCPQLDDIHNITEWLPDDFMSSTQMRTPDKVIGTILGVAAVVLREEPYQQPQFGGGTYTSHRRVTVTFRGSDFLAQVVYQWTPDDIERAYVNLDSDNSASVMGNRAAFTDWGMRAKLADHPMFRHGNTSHEPIVVQHRPLNV